MDNYLAHLKQENHRIFHSATGTDQFAIMYLISLESTIMIIILYYISTHVLSMQGSAWRRGGSIRHIATSKATTRLCTFLIYLKGK